MAEKKIFFCRIYPIVKQTINTLYHNGMKSTNILQVVNFTSSTNTRF